MPYVGDLQPSSIFLWPAYARLRVCLTRFADLLAARHPVIPARSWTREGLQTPQPRWLMIS